MNIPFIGPTYQARSLNINASRSINLYPELNQKDSKSVSSLIGTPGTSLLCTLPFSPVRGIHAFNNLVYAIVGNRLYSFNIGGGQITELGTLGKSTGFVSMSDNGLASAGVGGNQLMIADGQAGYIYNVNTGVFSQISGGGFPSSGAMTVTYMDGYFIVNTINSMSYFVSNLYDGTTWNALATSPVSAAPDFLMAGANLNQQLWLIKQYSSEVWYDTGTPTSQGSPFSRISGAVIDYGTPSPYSLGRGGGSLFWVGNQRNNDAGEFIGIVKLEGYVPKVISPPAINYQISKFQTVSDAFGYCYSEGGHTFYVVTFPGSNATFVYDDTVQMWHERSSYNGYPYSIGRHFANCYTFLNGIHIIGDYQSGNIYKMSSNYYDDNGNPIVSIRTAQHLFDKDRLTNGMIHQLQIDAETGNPDNLSFTGSPQAALSWSADYGHTWSSEYWASMGQIGQYGTRLMWRRLGYSRDKIFRLMISDAIKKVLIGCHVEATG